MDFAGLYDILGALGEVLNEPSASYTEYTRSTRNYNGKDMRMTKQEFLQGLRSELDGRVPYSVIQENLNYYDSYISGEMSRGTAEEQVIEELGGPRIIARTIVDAALDTEDRPDGYQAYGTGDSVYQETGGASYQQRQERREGPKIHYIDFSKWYVKLLAGLILGLILFLVFFVFFGFLWIFWPVLLVFLILAMFRGPRR